MKKSEIDRLGERLRVAVNAADLTLLDTYRREFQFSYESVAARLQAALGIEVSGRPAKSTPAIVDKLRRSSMRLSQMQDVAGCRIVVSGIAEQNQLCSKICALFDTALFDRRTTPSHGYRAIHLVVRNFPHPVEIQLRTSLQHAWAGLSEKTADVFDSALKYGGGPEEVRNKLDELSAVIAGFEGSIEPVAMWSDIAQGLKKNLHDKISDVTARLGAAS